MDGKSAQLSGESALAPLLNALHQEFPRFRIVNKRGSPLSHAIDVFLRVLTLGRQNRFISQYHTVIGSTLYVSDGWQAMSETERVILLRHERVHLRQRRRLTFPVMAFLYLIPLLPVGLAYGRARLEWEAYAETLAAIWQLRGREAAHDPTLRARVLERFIGPDYAWMWPFPRQVGRWYDQALEELDKANAS